MELKKFEELRSIDVTKHIEQKGKFSYLSWAWAVDTLLQHDPQATWKYDQPLFLQDGTVLVFCEVTAFGKPMKMQLPVLNYQNKAIKNPDSFAINTAMQRCLVKAIALHGIGLHIYAGEDLPPNPSVAPIEKTGNKALNEWVKDRMEWMVSYPKTDNPSTETLLKGWNKILYADEFEKITQDQRGILEDQYNSSKIQIERKAK